MVSRISFAAAMAVAALAGPVQAASFTLVQLGVMDGEISSTASRVNIKGQVLGSGGKYFVWTEADGFQALGMSGYDINDDGIVAGSSIKAGVGNVGATWNAGVITIIDNKPGSQGSTGLAINNNGNVVGSWQEVGYPVQAARFTDSGPNTLHAGASFFPKEANGINASGAIIGRWNTFPSAGADRAFYLEGGIGEYKLGTFGGDANAARGLNDFGMVVGWADTADGDSHAFRWSKDDGMVDLGTLGGADESVANAINNVGNIVGSSNGVATIWTGGMLYDLNKLIDPSSFTLTAAYDISVNGYIVGQGVTASGETRGFLLKPNGRVIEPSVPEPASWAMMIAGFGAIGASMRRRSVAVRFA